MKIDSSKTSSTVMQETAGGQKVPSSDDIDVFNKAMTFNQSDAHALQENDSRLNFQDMPEDSLWHQHKNTDRNLQHSLNSFSPMNTDVMHDAEAQQNTNADDLSSIFSSLLSDNSAQRATVRGNVELQAQSSLPLGDIDRLNELASTIVDKILVSDPKYSATSQVMITLSDNSAFAEMEIVLERATDGSLAVAIYTKNKNQTKDITSIQQDIVQALEKHENGIVNVTITQSADASDSEETFADEINYLNSYR